MKLANKSIAGFASLILALALWPTAGVAEIERMVIKIHGSMICSL